MKKLLISLVAMMAMGCNDNSNRNKELKDSIAQLGILQYKLTLVQNYPDIDFE